MTFPRQVDRKGYVDRREHSMCYSMTDGRVSIEGGIGIYLSELLIRVKGAPNVKLQRNIIQCSDST